jgi:uncharacterized protein YndB with AHSA1/START domain
MAELPSTHADVPDVRKTITVPAPPAEAFRILTQYPAEWLPAGHTFIRNPVSVTMEPKAGGRFYERGADGGEMTRGTIIEWAPPARLVVTWRVGPNWQPVFDDDNASRIVFDFNQAGSDSTEVVVTYTQLYRHGEVAGLIRSAIDIPGPGETLLRYAEAVTKHAEARHPR